MRARGRIVLSQNQPPPTHHPTRYGLPDQPVAKTVGKNAGAAGDEASLDTQYIIATGQGVPTWWVYINGHTANPFASWVAWASNTSQLPLVHSLSVGEPEAEFQVCVRGARVGGRCFRVLLRSCNFRCWLFTSQLACSCSLTRLLSV